MSEIYTIGRSSCLRSGVMNRVTTGALWTPRRRLKTWQRLLLLKSSAIG